DKVIKQGVPVSSVYQTLQAFLGGAYINQFNRFGRTWRVYLEAEGEGRMSPPNISQDYVRHPNGGELPLSTLVSTQRIYGPEYTNRFNLYRAAQVIGGPAPGYSSAQVLTALQQVADEVLPRDMSLAWADLSFQQQRAGSAAPVFALSLLCVFLI